MGDHPALRVPELADSGIFFRVYFWTYFMASFIFRVYFRTYIPLRPPRQLVRRGSAPHDLEEGVPPGTRSRSSWFPFIMTEAPVTYRLPSGPRV